MKSVRFLLAVNPDNSTRAPRGSDNSATFRTHLVRVEGARVNVVSGLGGRFVRVPDPNNDDASVRLIDKTHKVDVELQWNARQNECFRVPNPNIGFPRSDAHHMFERGGVFQ